MKDVTVVIPVYNRILQLQRALKSVELQNFTGSFEVIVVDDFSNDKNGIENVVKSFNDTLDIKLIRHTINRHGGAARNTGIKNSNSKYIAFLDSDDEWKSDKLSVTLKFLDENKDISGVFSKLELKGQKKGVFPQRGLHKDENYMDYLLIGGGTIQTSTIVIRREVLDKILFDESLKRFQDYDLVNSFQNSGIKLKLINQILVYMNDDDQQNRISNSFNPEPAEIWFKKVKSDLSDRAKANFIVKRLVHYYSQSGDKLTALKYLLLKDNFRYVKLKLVIKEFLLIIIPKIIVTKLRTFRINS